jgi:hypothetical protein
MPSSVYAAILAVAPIFEGITDTEIVMINPPDLSVEGLYGIRDQVCGELGLSDCNSLSPGLFHLNGMPDGEAYTISVEQPGYQSREVCIVKPPEEGHAPFASYVMTHTGYRFDYDNLGPTGAGPSDEELNTYNFLLLLTKCGRDGSIDQNLQSERDLAFASIATTLIHGNTNFLSYGGNTAAAMYATGLNSEAGKYGNAVAERILMEDFKKQVAERVGSQRGANTSCQVNVETSNQPRLPTFHEKIVPPSNAFRQCMTDERFRSNKRLTITDDVMYSIAPLFGEEANQTGMRDKGGDWIGGGPQRFDTGFVTSLNWSPFKNFGGSYERGLSYSWRTANQIVGIY